MFAGLHGSDKALLSSIVFALFGLALIGGLAMLCFTKAFGAVFLGTGRSNLHDTPVEAEFGKLIPMYAVVMVIMAIGLFPKTFVMALSAPLNLFTHLTANNISGEIIPLTGTMSMIGLCSTIFLGLAGLIFFVRKRITSNKPQTVNVTWGCGYIAPTPKMQYTASSFIRAYRKLAEPLFSIHKNKEEITGVFPKTGGQETHPYDKIEEKFIDHPLLLLKKFFNRFTFLQNGNLQFYILYGMVFILLVLAIPFLFEYINSLIKFLNQV
jgi:hypothetical protein